MSMQHNSVNGMTKPAVDDDNPMPDIHDWENGGFLYDWSSYFNESIGDFYDDLDKLLEELKKNPDDPAALADVQAMMGKYQALTGLQSNTTKTLKDIGQNTLANMR